MKLKGIVECGIASPLPENVHDKESLLRVEFCEFWISFYSELVCIFYHYFSYFLF